LHDWQAPRPGDVCDATTTNAAPVALIDVPDEELPQGLQENGFTRDSKLRVPLSRENCEGVMAKSIRCSQDLHEICVEKEVKTGYCQCTCHSTPSTDISTDFLDAAEHSSRIVSLMTGIKKQFLDQGWAEPLAEMFTLQIYIFSSMNTRPSSSEIKP
jgi:hypothetical protein